MFQRFDDNGACLGCRKVGNVVHDARLNPCVPKRIGIQEGLMGQQGNARELVSFTRLKIIEVMSRSDFDGTGSEFSIHQDRIAHDRDGPVGERKLDQCSYMPVVSGILWMNGNRGIAE